MEGECALQNDVSIAINGSHVRAKRKSNSTKRCFCEHFPTHKRNENKYRRQLLHPDVYKSANKFKLNAILSKLIKPCTVKVIPIDPNKCAHIINNSSSDFHQPFGNKTFVDLKDKKLHGHPVSKKSNILKKRKRRNLTNSDLLKFLKPCSVVLKRSNLNDFSKYLKINIPVSFCPAGQVKLKPCHVKLTRINNGDVRTDKPASYSFDVQKSCIVKLEEIDPKVFSSFNRCSNENIDSLHNTSCKQDLNDSSILNDSPSSDTNDSNVEKRTNGYVIEKHHDSSSSHTVKELQIPFQPNELEAKFDKVFKSPSFDILKDENISCFANKSSASPFISVEPYSKPVEKASEQCEIQGSKIDMHRCCQCSKALPSLKSFYYHVCHGKQKRGYPCKFCEKNFDFFHALRKHKKSHALRNSLSCTDTVKSRRGQSNGLSNFAAERKRTPKNTPLKTIFSTTDKNIKKSDEGKENSSSPKLKPKKFKKRVFLKNASDATTSSGCYSSDLNFSQHVLNPDDSEVD